MQPLQSEFRPFHPRQQVREARAWLPLLRGLGVSGAAALAVRSGDPGCWVRIWALARAAGQPFMPLAPDLRGARLNALLEGAGEVALLELGRGAHTPRLRRLYPPRQPPDPAAADLRLILHTSGSEGAPRGVMHTGRALDAASAAACRRLGFAAGDLWLACLAPWHIGGIAILERARHCGGRVLALPGFDAARVWRALRRHPVSHLSLVPAMLGRLLDEAAGCRPPSSLRRVLIGGGALSRPLYERASAQGWPLCVSYGLSEAGSQVATDCGDGAPWRPGAAGLPLEGVEVAIEAGDVDTPGRILLRGPMLMSGYLNPARRPGDGLAGEGWFRSGDLGYLEQGRLHVLGRGDDVIVSAGVNVHPALVERALQRHPGVREAVVVGVADPLYGERITALVVGRVEPDALLAWCREHISSAERPRRVVSLDALPRLGNGKPDRMRLRRLAGQA